MSLSIEKNEMINKIERIYEEIDSSKMSDEDKTKMFVKIFDYIQKSINIMIVGNQGCGKTSTINAIFNPQIIKEDNFEYKAIQKYELNNLTLMLQ